MLAPKRVDCEIPHPLKKGRKLGRKSLAVGLGYYNGVISLVVKFCLMAAENEKIQRTKQDRKRKKN